MIKRLKGKSSEKNATCNRCQRVFQNLLPAVHIGWQACTSTKFQFHSFHILLDILN